MNGDHPQRDRASIEAVLDTFEGPLVAYATRLLRDTDRARDVVQDTFLRLCEQHPPPVPDALPRWLYTVCRNRAMDVLRKESRMTPLDQATALDRPAPEAGPAEVAATRDAAAHALATLAGLPLNQQEVLELKLRHHLSYAEIAAVTGHSVGNVGFLIHTALKNLRARLGVPEPSQPAPGGAR